MGVLDPGAARLYLAEVAKKKKETGPVRLDLSDMSLATSVPGPLPDGGGEPSAPIPMLEAVESSRERYATALKQMDKGVSELQVAGHAPQTSLKALRVDINRHEAEASAILAIMVAKGVVTEEEVESARADAMEKIRDRYLASVRSLLGHYRTLG